MKIILIKALIISLTFVAGFFLVERILAVKIKHKRIYCLLIELAYFFSFWTIIYIKFIP